MIQPLSVWPWEWTKEEADHYENLSDMYAQVIGQFSRYVGHVSRNVGGVYETYKTVEEAGDVYETTPKAIQKEAVSFLNKQLFQTPNWLLDKNILNKISMPTFSERIQTIQVSALKSLLDGSRMARMIAGTNRFGDKTYTADEMVQDVRNEIWTELASKKAIDNYRRNLQKEFVEQLISLANSQQTVIQLAPGITLTSANFKTTDVSSIARGHLRSLQSEISAASAGASDKMSRYHLQDMSDRIKKALDPK